MLSKKELARFASLVNKVKDPRKGLPEPVFLALCKLVPFVACEIVIINKKKEILLTWRKDKWWKGWHFPGGLMRFKENFEERLKKTALSELGVKIEKFKFLFPVNYNKNTRGHSVSLVFLCEAKTKPKEGKFFKKMPRNIIDEHKETWRLSQKKIK